MSQPTREYSFITAITPEEIRAMGRPQHGDFIWIGKTWEPMEINRALTHYEPHDITRRPINPDPSMPSGQKRWEIVPACEVETRDMEYTLDGLVWHPNNSPKSRGVASWGAVLAFRRPIALKEAGAGSLEEKPKPMFAGNTRALVEKITALQSELTQLRTLAKDQGEALEKAEEALKRASGEIEGWRKSEDDERSRRGSDAVYENDYIPDYITDTLTLIAKFKEVGE